MPQLVRRLVQKSRAGLARIVDQNIDRPERDCRPFERALQLLGLSDVSLEGLRGEAEPCRNRIDLRLCARHEGHTGSFGHEARRDRFADAAAPARHQRVAPPERRCRHQTVPGSACTARSRFRSS